ncbi:hypothetical protein LCGC14_2653120 [marine sediment metagenome]|uniref:Uncharacterized protein n=1 Tax=marine sediment metagenome TaxID=412755 RepID=A0A0F9AGK7_9ZZZZ
MTKINDPFDELFVCSNCGSSIAGNMPKITEMKRRLRYSKEALQEAIDFLESAKEAWK